VPQEGDPHVAAASSKDAYRDENAQMQVTEPTLEKRHIEIYDLLLVFQKRCFCLDTKSKYQFDNEGPPSKNSHIEHDLVFIFKTSRINDTHSQGYYCQTKALNTGTLPQKHVILKKKMNCFWYPDTDVFISIPKASVNMTVREGPPSKQTVIL
jgi:hypothetical protein